MKVEIHDVDHGACAIITGPSGHRLMLDCGESIDRPWFPSVSYSGERIDTLMLMNLDEDHVADLSGIWDHCPLGALVTNPTVSAAALQAMKPSGMWSGVRKAHELIAHFGPGFIGSWSHDLGGVRWQAFWNRYGTDFTDTNNLSLAVFVTFGNFTILFGGDMEKPGWKKLMENEQFRMRLFDVTVFVASHHGRENGKFEDMFLWMKPEITVISDCNKKHGTQETTAWYAGRSKGIPDYSASQMMPTTRRVYTTRRDGTITMQVGTDGRYTVFTEAKTKPVYNHLASLLAGDQPTALSGQQPLGLLAALGR